MNNFLQSQNDKNLMIKITFWNSMKLIKQNCANLLLSSKIGIKDNCCISGPRLDRRCQVVKLIIKLWLVQWPKVDYFCFSLSWKKLLDIQHLISVGQVFQFLICKVACHRHSSEKKCYDYILVILMKACRYTIEQT